MIYGEQEDGRFLDAFRFGDINDKSRAFEALEFATEWINQTPAVEFCGFDYRPDESVLYVHVLFKETPEDEMFRMAVQLDKFIEREQDNMDEQPQEQFWINGFDYLGEHYPEHVRQG